MLKLLGKLKKLIGFIWVMVFIIFVAMEKMDTISVIKISAGGVSIEIKS